MKKKIALACAGAMMITTAAGSVCMAEETTAAVVETAAADETAAAPKYIFLFIGDGMSYPQIQLTNYYMNAMQNDPAAEILTSSNQLSFFDFQVAGSAQTYDSTSFCPDSASTATSISTGNKTYSGTINMDETGTTPYETIAEKLKKQKDYKIGVISSVNLNHATPAAFYAHQASRNDYYEIGLEMIDSNFDYFAGGGLKETTGENKDQTDLYEVAAEAGYTVVNTQADAEAVTADTGKTIIIDEHLADSDSMAYDMDLTDGEWALADYVSKGIDVLDNENGFFMMVEGGKIDWACHANDAAATITDTVALSNAVQEAIDFYNEHPEETLILVTGDHETGGLTIGYAGTNYDTFLTNLANQKISYAKYDSDYVSAYKENKTDFDTVMADVTELFGLQAPAAAEEEAATLDSADSHPHDAEGGSLEMTEWEYEKLQAAYEETMTRAEDAEIGQEDYILYGSYEPLTVTITHILNNKSGVDFSSYSHTGLPVEVFAQGTGAESFEGYYDNTGIYFSLAALTGVE
ncbi:MAG: alkaline phosphatase [Lachnospiraceae bacterium]|nr:alkaline phosphatase [Lachnospiraceae bacterium]MDD3794362.1 alkaline phosphatase [Lachnospiraceae bacterium]